MPFSLNEAPLELFKFISDYLPGNSISEDYGHTDVSIFIK
jgi:hypothetical protein